MPPLRLGVLVSGSGTNLQAIAEACAGGRLDAEVGVVISNVPGAGALARARSAGIPAVVVDHRAHPDRDAFEHAVVEVLRAHGVEWVVLAGFMRLFGPVVLAAWPEHIVNIHPSLLPAFPGLHAPRQAVRKGVRVAGCTVHLVDAGTDTGPILAQAVVPVRPDDDADALQARIQTQEHRLYPQVLQWISEGRLRRENGRAWLEGAPLPGGAFVVPGPGVAA